MVRWTKSSAKQNCECVRIARRILASSSFVTKNLKPIRSIMRSYHLRSEQSRFPTATLPNQPQSHIVKAVGDSSAPESCVEDIVAAVQRASFIGMEYTRFALGLIATELERGNKMTSAVQRNTRTICKETTFSLKPITYRCEKGPAR